MYSTLRDSLLVLIIACIPMFSSQAIATTYEGTFRTPLCGSFTVTVKALADQTYQLTVATATGKHVDAAYFNPQMIPERGDLVLESFQTKFVAELNFRRLDEISGMIYLRNCNADVQYGRFNAAIQK